ncbi:MAG: hypothetical protein LBU09_02440, partial [Endomicrobium sp.]|nr:hypothetical protein [Endomicrobium sp.]
MKFLFAILFSFAAVLPVFAQERLVFENYGFSIEKLEVSEKEIPDNFQTIVMFLPVDNNFAPNVNVVVQKYKENIKTYAKASVEQFKSYGMKLINQTQNDKEQTAIFEYSGQMSGVDLYFYSKAISSKGKVYLVTGTTTVLQWDKIGDTI